MFTRGRAWASVLAFLPQVKVAWERAWPRAAELAAKCLKFFEREVFEPQAMGDRASAFPAFLAIQPKQVLADSVKWAVGVVCLRP